MMPFREILSRGQFLTIAHRGASGSAPENTSEAFELALRQGMDALEVDVHLTADDHVVVMHDASVDRTTDGAGEIRSMPLAAIRRLDAGRWFGEQWRGARVPTLEDVIARFGDRALLDIELKGGVTVHDPRTGATVPPPLPALRPRAVWFDRRNYVSEVPEVAIRLADRTLESAARLGALDRISLSSFGADVLLWIREHAPEVPTQLIVVAPAIAEDCSFAQEAGFRVVSPQNYAATEPNVAEAHRRGLAVFIWERNDEAAMSRLIDLGADAVKTDYPDRLSAVLKRRTASPPLQSPGRARSGPS